MSVVLEAPDGRSLKVNAWNRGVLQVIDFLCAAGGSVTVH